MTAQPLFPTLILIAVGTNAQASYQPFPVAAYYPGLIYPREIYAGASVYDDGKPYAQLTFKALEAHDFVTTLTLAGVASAKVASVTIRLPDTSRLGYADWNGQAIQPFMGRDAAFTLLRYGPDTPTVLIVRKLEAAS